MATIVPSDKTTFGEARDRPAGPERQAYLDGVRWADPQQRARVEQLLADLSQAGSFLESLAPDFGATVAELIGEKSGSIIDAYCLKEPLGQGGFGVVFQAEQLHPVRRSVALKVLKPGMDTREVVARFEAERQALALMNHPNIARVFDAGSTAQGRPYFVMELVQAPQLITDYCDQHRLSLRQRLELFVDVCEAVHHAHQKGVIHRDLKPSNILVTVENGQAVVKVIDFGIAKAVGQR